MAERTELATAPGLRLHRAPIVTLLHSGAGYECAGSCARWVDSYYAVRWHDGSAYRGTRYPDTPAGDLEARRVFEKLTTSEEGR